MLRSTSAVKRSSAVAEARLGGRGRRTDSLGLGAEGAVQDVRLFVALRGVSTCEVRARGRRRGAVGEDSASCAASPSLPSQQPEESDPGNGTHEPGNRRESLSDCDTRVTSVKASGDAVMLASEIVHVGGDLRTEGAEEVLK
jgi:hypothetical protein